MAIDWGIALGVVGVIGIPGAIGIGVTTSARTPGEFRFARQCFVVTAILIIASWAWLTNGYSLGLIKINIDRRIGRGHGYSRRRCAQLGVSTAGRQFCNSSRTGIICRIRRCCAPCQSAVRW